jgi:hypothetical protein
MFARLSPLLAAAALLVFAAPALADEFDVTATTPGSGTCIGGPPVWQCTTLETAVDEANANDEEDEIFLQAAGTYNVNGTLTLRDAVSIFGVGARVTRIDGGDEGVRVVDVLANVTATLGNVTIQNGDAGTGDGGNIRNAGDLSLLLTRVTGGAAGTGGGIANEPGGTLGVFASLIDGNAASGGGGGISTSGGPVADPNPSHVDIAASTLGLNVAANGGGILVTGGSSQVVVGASTIATNITGGGIAIANAVDEVDISGSLLAGNDGGNCASALKPIDEGFNLEDANTCGLDVGSGSKINANPGLSAQPVDAGGPTNVFTFAANSPAVDMVAPCGFPYDQRFFLRTANPGQDPCDAGAYELSANGALITSGPPPTTTATSATFAFAAADETATFVCQFTGPGRSPGYSACTSPATYSGLAPGDYVFQVALADANGQPSTVPSARTFSVRPPAVPAPTPTPAPTPSSPTPAPTPVPQKDATGKPSGTVLIKQGGKFVPFDASKPIPDGAEIDVTKGRIELTAVLKKGGKPEKATFYDGIFKLKLGKTTTDLVLSQPLAPCGRGKAGAAAKKPKTRKLWGNGSGSFRTRGQYSAATVRGTQWLVQDSCAGTLTKVTKGVVSVFDQVKKRTIVLRAGKSYLAKPRR